MKEIKNHSKAMVLGPFAVLVLMLFFSSIHAQEQEKVSNAMAAGKQADLDWKELKYFCGNFGADYQEAVKKSVLEMRRIEDKAFKKCSQLAKLFWDNYPTDKRRYKALYMFFSPLATPYFISDKIPDSQVQKLAALPRTNRKLNRLILGMVDHVEREKWLRAGDNIVADVLNSSASLQRKEEVEFLLIGREFRLANYLKQGLPHVYSLKQGKDDENDYWVRFEEQYWQPVLLRLENHVNKYAVMEIVSERVKNILDVIKQVSKFSSSPTASDAYWAYFHRLTGVDNPLADQAGIKALHKLAAENLAAIEASKLVDYTKPLEMEFVAMDGANINLADMRGKVVLIDFWSTYCGPCIAEMPHLRALYDKYRDDGFEVIGIAANGDSDKESVQEILDDKNANWPQRLDKGSDASISFHSLYNITSLPTVWLLNKEGVIVDRNARGERLEPLIRNHLGLDK